MKKIALLMSMAAAVLFSSCGGSKEKVIVNENLKAFMYGGVYFIHGYGGADAFFGVAETEVGDTVGGRFLKQLESWYEYRFLFPYTQDDIAGAKEVLSDDWDINSKEDLYATLDYLLATGHQELYSLCRKALDENGGAVADIAAIDLTKYELDNSYLREVRFVKDNYARFASTGIKAWDYVRYVNNVAMGYAAAYITKEEAYEQLKKLTAATAGKYESWAAYFNEWELGRMFWGGDDSSSFTEVVAGIGDNTNPYNIYRYVAI